MTSARISDKDVCHRACNLFVFSRVQKGTPRLTHKGRVLQRVSLGARIDVMVILRMRQSIGTVVLISVFLYGDSKYSYENYTINNYFLPKDFVV